MMNEEDRLYKIHAEFCQTLANPKRLKIINLLSRREMQVNEIASAMGIQKANLSQHLSVMRQKGIVATRREGVTVYYRINNSKIVKACEIIREALHEQLSADERLVRSAITKSGNALKTMSGR
jgi:ArsR family transcriptional regulator, virulence genes transcriptional regulator